MALWFSASFAGNLLAGGLGSLWTRLGPSRFFLLTCAVAAFAALLLRLVDAPARRALGRGH
jgi:POT family proton-dependent oligopeptide transporter